jgi:hypothetical protein
LNERVVCTLHREPVGRRDERQACVIGDLGCRGFGEAGAELMPGPTAVPPSVSGVASCMCVRPILTMLSHSFAFASIELSSAATAGIDNAAASVTAMSIL